MYKVSHSGYVHVDFARILRDIGVAFWVLGEDGKSYVLPKSAIAHSRDYHVGDRNGVISITENCARKKGMI